MPGICGIIASRNRVNLKHEFDAMFGSMRQYDHEKSQKHESDTACFGMVSLASAIKRNPAEKIISNSDSIFLSSNPQLDDHRAILDLLENNVQATQEPTEAELLRALDWQTNPDLLARAYGNWSFAQYSFTTKKLSLA